MTSLRTTDRPESRPESDPPPRLDSGDRMDSETFMAIYEQMPEDFRAQLIEGVVLVASPMTAEHGGPLNKANGWLFTYQARTPGVFAYDATTIRLGPKNSPEPDASLLVHPDCGGQARFEGTYIVGAPELVVEVSYSSWAVDLNEKRNVYQAAGVREYVVIILRDSEVRWHVLRDGRFERATPDNDGLYRSTVFPGLWLDPAALLVGDATRLIAAVDRGTATPEHAAFVARLAEARKKSERGMA
jgi:Uma2 family endonuclease